MTNYATLDDLTALFRPLEASETDKANLLLQAASANLRAEARRRNKDFDAMLADDPDLLPIAKEIICHVVGNALNANVHSEPMSQVSQSALGYSVSGTYAVPGGGLFFKNSELRRLGLMRQQVGTIDPFGGEALC